MSGRSAYDSALDVSAADDALTALGGSTVLVAGCGGLVGGTLVQILTRANRGLLRDNPVQVVGLSRSARAPAGGARSVAGSVDDPDVVRRLPRSDYVVYVAGVASDYRRRANEIIATQYVGLSRFLEVLAPWARGFTFISSTRVYGRIVGEGLIAEDQPASVQQMSLDNLYDAHKWFAESLCRQHAEAGSPCTVARLTNIYGVPDAIRSDTAVTDFVRQALHRRVIQLTGHPGSVRNHCSAPDAALGILRVLTRGRPGTAYNVGSTEHLTTLEMAEAIQRLIPFAPQIERSAETGPPSIQRISIERARRDLGYEPRYSFAELGPEVVEKTVKLLR